MENDIGQLELFVADIFDVAVKGDMETMEHPLFSLSTRPDTEKWLYQYNDTRLEVTPSVDGRPTIFDKDLLMFCVSQVVEGENRGRPISRRVRFTAHQFLKATGRGTAGKDYEAMLMAMKRLRGVTFTFEGSSGKKRRGEVRGLIDDGKVVETGSRMASVEITLSEWVYEAIESKNVLTYHPDYYRLRKPNERRLYEICRKFCGTQPIWEIGIEKLYMRFGTRAPKHEWLRTMRKLIPLQTIPEYLLTIDEDREVFIVEHMPRSKPSLAAC